MVTIFQTRPDAAVRVTHGGVDDAAEFTRAVMAAVLDGGPATFAVEAASAARVAEVMTPQRVFLLMMGRASGRVSATISPRFSEETYPALLDVIGRLNDAGAGDLWRPDGARTVGVGSAKHMFVSIDMPVVERSAKPDCLLEVVEAHRVPAAWYRSRVMPRVKADGLVRVFYGRPGVTGSAFDMAQAEAMAEEALTGERRQFSFSDRALV